MNSFYKYHSKLNNWGLYINTCGYYDAPIESNYPPKGHPCTHSFRWEEGRILKACYIIYITSGKGEFETKSVYKKILPGDVILLYPGEWHRYRPDLNTGWEEYWIGFNGPTMCDYIQKDLFPEQKSYVKNIGYHDEVVRLFSKALCYSKNDNPSFSKMLIGIVLQLIAHIESPGHQSIPGKKEDYIYEDTVSKIRQNLKEGVDFQQLADSFNMSYTHFRKLFKDRAGIPLNSFLIQERLKYARSLLHSSELNIEEISEKCGFNSVYYFSRLFSERVGLSPGRSRKHKSLSIA